MAMTKKILKIGFRDPQRDGIAFMARINFWLSSILATLQTESDWRVMMEDFRELEHHGLA